MNFYIIACILSGITAIFTILSAWTPDKEKSFFFQTAQCLTYAAASWFYGVYPAIVSMLLCAIRNYLVARGKYKAVSALVLTATVAVLGMITNTSGLTGFIPVIATIEYGILLCVFTGLIATRANIIINLALWVIYDFFIRDYINLTVDSVSCILAVRSLIRVRDHRRAG